MNFLKVLILLSFSIYPFLPNISIKSNPSVQKISGWVTAHYALSGKLFYKKYKVILPLVVVGPTEM